MNLNFLHVYMVQKSQLSLPIFLEYTVCIAFDDVYVAFYITCTKIYPHCNNSLQITGVNATNSTKY